MVGKAFIPRKLRHSRRGQTGALFYIVNSVQGKPAALLEKGINDLPIVPLTAAGLQLLPQCLGFQRVVPPQGGIAPADQQKILARPTGRGKKVPGYLPVDSFRFHAGHPPGIGQNKKHAVLILKGFLQGLLFPVGINIHVMDSLNPGRIVVQNHDFASELFQLFL